MDLDFNLSDWFSLSCGQAWLRAGMLPVSSKEYPVNKKPISFPTNSLCYVYTCQQVAGLHVAHLHFQYPPGTIHSYYNMTDYISYNLLYIP